MANVFHVKEKYEYFSQLAHSSHHQQYRMCDVTGTLFGQWGVLRPSLSSPQQTATVSLHRNWLRARGDARAITAIIPAAWKTWLGWIRALLSKLSAQIGPKTTRPRVG